MYLPHADNTIVEREKIVAYLLNPSHLDNAGKASFFNSLGFSQDAWENLALALCNAAQQLPVSKTVASSHRMKYIVDGRIVSPNGKTAQLRSIWIIDVGLDTPRLVTAYPREK
ncbi:MAG TPA: hypothetical protein VGO67_01130 [Verrucomicrobiae bacterium]|jgi:hypothetical protein